MGEVTWVRIALIAGSILAVVMACVLLLLVLQQTRFDSYQKDINAKERLLHTRISELTNRMEELSRDIQEIELLIEPHRRVTEMERWQRTFCSGTKLEACALLRKVER